MCIRDSVFECQIVSVDVQCVQASLSCIDVGSVVLVVIPSGQMYARNPLSLGAGKQQTPLRLTPVRNDEASYFVIAARKAVKYFSGNAATFILESVTMCVVSPSASNVRLSARTSS